MKSPTCFIIVFSLFLNMVVSAQPIVIKADVTKGCDKLSVYFTYTSTVLPVTSIKWDFGGGVTSVSPNPTVAYSVPGSYAVKLVINGTDSVTENNFIKVGQTPKSKIVYKDTLDTYSLVIRAELTGNDSPFPYQYKWVIEGGITETHQTFIHQFDSTGLYKARLIVSDAIGCADTVNSVITVAENFGIPNVFTPNDDGFNDDFKVTSSGKSLLKLRIFAPSGIMVYKSEAKILKWDGRLPSGEKVLPGIYFYTIETGDASPSINKSGFFYIFR